MSPSRATSRQEFREASVPARLRSDALEPILRHEMWRAGEEEPSPKLGFDIRRRL